MISPDWEPQAGQYISVPESWWNAEEWELGELQPPWYHVLLLKDNILTGYKLNTDTCIPLDVTNDPLVAKHYDRPGLIL